MSIGSEPASTLHNKIISFSLSASSPSLCRPLTAGMTKAANDAVPWPCRRQNINLVNIATSYRCTRLPGAFISRADSLAG